MVLIIKSRRLWCDTDTHCFRPAVTTTTRVHQDFHSTEPLQLLVEALVYRI